MLNNIPLLPNQQNLSIPVSSGGLNQLPVGVFDASQYRPRITPVQNQQSATPSIDTATLRDIVLNLPQQQEGLRDEWSPFKTGNSTADYFLNLIPNAIHDLPEIGTGAVNMLAHPIENVFKPIGQWATEVAPYESTGERLGDIVNALGAKAAGLDVKRTAEGYKRLFEGDIEGAKAIGNELRGEFIENFRKNPLIVSSILFPGATAKATGTTTRAALQGIEDVSKGKIPWGSKGKAAGRIQDLATSELSGQLATVREAANEMVNEAKKAGGNATGNIAQVLDAWERGTEVPQNLKPLENAWTKMQEAQLKLLPAEGLESSQTLALNQFRARQTGTTYNQAAREFLPLEEMLYEGIDIGNPAAIEARLKGLRADKTLSNVHKRVAELTEGEVNSLSQYLENYEINALREADMTIRDARNYLAEKVGETRRAKGTKLTQEQQIRYKENLNKISEMAAGGDAIAADFIEGLARFDKGLLKPVLHAGIRDVEGLGTLTAEELSGRRLAGKGSSREYGTATPEQIAKAYTESLNQVIDNIAEAKMDRHVSETLLRGEFADGTPLVSGTSKVVKYIDAGLLEEGRLKSALASASDVASVGSVAIDESFLNALKNQFGRVDTSPFTGVLADGYNLMKDAVLNSGFYLGGNALSGVANTLINSNIALFDDVLNAVKTQGKLSKQLGTYRDVWRDSRKFRSELAGNIHKVNRAAGGKFVSAADAAMQNTFSEIAAHAKLRREGVISNNRLASLTEMPKAKLADIINDVRNVSLMNSSRRVIPQGWQSVTGLNPFFNWQVTAAQASYYTLMNHPLISQLIAANVFGRIGFDNELQRRLNIGVKSDKQLVSFRMDQRTGEIKETNMDFLPQLTSMKFLMEPTSVFRSVPLIGDILNAAQGKNAYGQPLKRTHSGINDGTIIQGTNRYKRNARTGEIEAIDGQLDEFISSIIRNTSGIPNLANKLVGPSAAAAANFLTGTDKYRFYQPYAQSVFGSFSTGQADTPFAMFSSGNPMAGRAGQETLRSILNQYEQTYYPENQPRMNKAWYSGMAKTIRRENAKLP